VRLGDLHRPDRGRKVGPRAHPIPDLVEVVSQIGLELLKRLPIHSRGTLVGRNPPVRLPHQRLGNRKRLVFGPWHVLSRFLPGLTPRLIESTFLVSRPLGSTATPASSDLTATTGRSAGERRVGTQCLRFLPRHAPSRDLRACDPGRHIDARLLTFRARAADQAHAASTPGTAWPVRGYPPGSSRGTEEDPRFRCQLVPIDASTATPNRISPAERFWHVFPVPT
jgi:hypothetical protein